MSNDAPTPPAADALLVQRDKFKAFLINRVGSVADAEDILQNGLIKGLKHAGEVQDNAKFSAWFYQLLRRAVVDHVRSRTSATSRELAWSAANAASTEDDEREICRCFEALIPTLKPKHAALLRLVELDGQSVATAAAALGITANSASVTLHRARAELRAQLEAFCRDCAKSACLDCDCARTGNG